MSRAPHPDSRSILILTNATVKAVQDYDYMVHSSKLPLDPFLVTGERNIDAFVIHSIMGDLQDSKLDPILVDGPWETESNQPIGGTRTQNVAKNWIKGIKERIIMATLGGFFLVGPMWLMVLYNKPYTSLISTTVLVVVFGLMMVWFLERPMDVMSATAAYAAVLVVFVGLANGTSN
jgi:hypothetical protein